MTKAKTLITIVGTVMAGRTALNRVRQAREDGDRLELARRRSSTRPWSSPALIVIVRRMRRGEDEA